jgi:hypothetical protein
MLDYERSDKCAHPIAEAFKLLGEPMMHEDYKATKLGYTWNLHIAQVRPEYLTVHLSLKDGKNLVGVKGSLYSIDSKVLEFCSTSTQKKYRMRGLGMARTIETMRVVEALGYVPESVVIRRPISPSGRALAEKMGFAGTADGGMATGYDKLKQRLFAKYGSGF